ncbi:MAG: A/G-specific adenine glycosylase [Clostridiales bacterium]|nr:A/G-specific adenine glycosylase [Clostridiales bacterium]
MDNNDDRNNYTDRLKAINEPLLVWYAAHARELPWRSEPAPYRVWISEIMLQQTRVEAVRSYFDRFMRALPDVAALAAVDDDRLMKLWEGLGYYSRARNLKKAAQRVMETYGGVIPSEPEELLTLPGIGDYTAGAIASIAFGRAVPAVDGNVLRVISRLLASRGDITKATTKKQITQFLSETMPRSRCGDFTQALFEVGALICVPNGAPKCGECPLRSLCLAADQELTAEIPVKTAAKPRRVEERTVCIFERGGEVALRRRPPEGLLASLYELPNAEGKLEPDEVIAAFGLTSGTVLEIEPLPAAKHIFSHVEWRMIGYRLRLNGDFPTGCIAADKEKLDTTYALPNAFAAYKRFIC